MRARAERFGRHYLRQQGYKISTCHCDWLLHDLDGWRYVHEKLNPDDSEIGYWEKGGNILEGAYPLGGFHSILNYFIDDIAFKDEVVYAVEYKSSKGKPTWHVANRQKERFKRLKKFGFKLLIVHVPINVDYVFDGKKLDVSFDVGDIETLFELV